MLSHYGVTLIHALQGKGRKYLLRAYQVLRYKVKELTACAIFKFGIFVVVIVIVIASAQWRDRRRRASYGVEEVDQVVEEDPAFAYFGRSCGITEFVSELETVEENGVIPGSGLF